MAEKNPLQRILASGVVAVMRAPSGEVLADVAEALLAGGVEAIEVTFTVPKAHRVIEQVADRLGDKIVLGAGTVLDPETARTAILAGARFIVGPAVNLDVIRLCRRYSFGCNAALHLPIYNKAHTRYTKLGTAAAEQAIIA